MLNFYFSMPEKKNKKKDSNKNIILRHFTLKRLCQGFQKRK
jgi:hypothetical protein